LRTDVDLPQSLDDLRWRGAHRKRLTAICERIGERAIVDRVHAFAD